MRRRAALAAALLALLAWRGAGAAGPGVDLQLVLAVDASGSVNQARFELQRSGYAQAFADPRVIRAIQSGPEGAIAVTMVQWTGPFLQARVFEWRRIDGPDAAASLADFIASAPRQLFSGGTAVGAAIAHSAGLFADCPWPAPRRVIDVSGDGANNIGPPAAAARDAAVAAGITVNGLPIVAVEPGLDRWYERNVIGGPGAFLVVAESFEAFAGAIRDKLVAEIALDSDRARERDFARDDGLQRIANR